MSKYEIISIIISTIAILIPILQWIWKTWIKKPKLEYYPTGKAYLFFNQSGSYVRIDGVFEAFNKPISIKKMNLKVKRIKDNSQLSLDWSGFISPVNQSFIGTMMQTTEKAHPFRIEADSICCAFTEFSDDFDSFGKALNSNTGLAQKANGIMKKYNNYNDALKEYQNDEEYKNAKLSINKDLFWEISKYSFEIEVEYAKEIKVFKYQVEVNQQDYYMFTNNIDEILTNTLKDYYGIKRNYYTAILDLRSL